MARPGARGLVPGLGLKYDNRVAGRAGPGHTFCGPGLIIQFASRSRAGSAQLLRARSRAGSAQLLRARAGPGPQIIFAGRAWA